MPTTSQTTSTSAVLPLRAPRTTAARSARTAPSLRSNGASTSTEQFDSLGEIRTTQIRYLLPEEIEADPTDNNRFRPYTETDLDDLLEDLAAGIGIEHALMGRQPSSDAYQARLVSGFRRHAAVTLWNSRHKPSEAVRLPIVIRASVNGEDAAEANLRENLHRHSLSPMDYAAGIRKFRNAGRSDEAICKLYGGMSSSWLANKVKLLVLERRIQERVHSGEVRGSVALLLATMDASYRDLIVAAHDVDRLKFTMSSVVRVARQCGAMCEGGGGEETAQEPVERRDRHEDSDGAEQATSALSGQMVSGTPNTPNAPTAAPSSKPNTVQSAQSSPVAAPKSRTSIKPVRARSPREQREWIEDFKISHAGTVSAAGLKLLNALDGFVAGKLGDSEMNKVLWEVFPVSETDATA